MRLFRRRAAAELQVAELRALVDSLRAENERLRALPAFLEAENERLRAVPSDPQIRAMLFSIKGVAMDGDYEICMLGPRGCETHRGWEMSDGSCGVAWVRGWLYRERASSPRAMVVMSMIDNDEDRLLPLIADALEQWRPVAADESYGKMLSVLAGSLIKAIRQ